MSAVTATREFTLAYSPRPKGCAGWEGKCRNAPEYVAEIAYCSCCEAGWLAHQHLTDRDEHHPDLEPDVQLCRDCTVHVRQWDEALISIRSLRPLAESVRGTTETKGASE